MKKIIFLGDSITDSNHNWNVDELGLGDGYVSVIAQKLKEKGESVKILNRGHDGFTVHALRRFLVQDCLLQKPDVVSVLIGCNDVGMMMNTGRGLEERRFEEAYEKLIVEIHEETNADIICMAPFIFPHPQEYANWIPGILKVEEIIQKTAEKHEFPFIPLHDAMQEAAGQYGYGNITTDGIHLTRQGAAVIAEKWMEVWGKCLNDSNLTKQGKSDTITNK